MDKGLFAGLDVSTQSCKLVVIDMEAESVIFTESVNYDQDLPQYRTKNGVIQNQPEGVSESDPRMWIDALHVVFKQLKTSAIPPEKILCMSVSGQQHGLVSLDKEGNLTRPTSKLWNDFSTLEECRLLTEAAGGLDTMIEEVGNSQRTGYTAAKIYHMYRHEPDNYQKTATFFLVHNYINWYLTGGKKGGVRVMEPGDTSGMALWNPKTRNWSKKVINLVDTGLMAKLPPIQPSEKSIGTISSDLVNDFGFSPACKIDAGTGDNMYGAIGTGNVRPGIVTVSLGTSGTAYTFMEEAFIDPTGEIAAFCDSTGNYLPLLCVSNLANGNDKVMEMYGLSFREFEDTLKKTKPGNAGRILIPWYMGERTPDVPKAAPVYFGFGLDDFTKEILCRAVLEGHVHNLYDGFQRMPVKPVEIRLTGGMSKSEGWCQTIADIFNAQTVPVEGEGAALGAALHAAWVWYNEAGKKYSIEDVVNPLVILDESRRRKPIADNVKMYETHNKLFSALSKRVRGYDGDDPFALREKLL